MKPSKKKDFAKGFDDSISFEDVFSGAPKPISITRNTEVIQEEMLVMSEIKHKSSERKKPGRPRFEDEAERRDEKFTFNTTKALSELIRQAMMRHNNELKQYGVKLDESKFLEYLISTHPKVAG